MLHNLQIIPRLLCLLSLTLIFDVSAELNISAAFLPKIENKYGAEASARVEQWQSLMQSGVFLSEQDKLQRVNDFFNQHIKFTEDIYTWGVNDYWATPLELLTKGMGDCEDYSIAKYFTLLELGVPEKKMRIVYVKAVKLNQAHMVLAYYSSPRAIPVLLDNLIPRIKLATERMDLLPVYSFNGSGLWLAKSRGRGEKVGSAGQLNMWTELKQRMFKSAI
ncbi:sulfate adenylyltransferase [Methyloprofundus sedimenti]|uniref:Sulfate adenylyltransferase n=1 Tax=Methyloprofundus sedimenti TaxID=1420851 RepID=A0A1V8M673_9GAMM|nr:transglutaminase-like cysteine peptidase [Methyloprofundus sedimenti]OQK17059.1 sulfate adenylyltransferase [Methyloprofundus sedimenti]